MAFDDTCNKYISKEEALGGPVEQIKIPTKIIKMMKNVEMAKEVTP